MRDWSHEPGDPFLMYAFGIGALVLAVLLGYWTVTTWNTHTGYERIADMCFLLALWVIVGLMGLLFIDSRDHLIRHRNTYTKFLKVPVEEIEERLRTGMEREGLRYAKRRVTSPLERIGIGDDAEVHEYLPEDEGLRVTLEHWGPTRVEPERDHSLLIVGPMTDDAHPRTLSLIRAYESAKEREPPSVVVFSRSTRHGTCARSTEDDA
jgi:hypothetical protein